MLVLLSAAFVVRPRIALAQDVKDISARLAESITKSGKKSIAVVDFTDLQGHVTELGRFWAEEFSVALANDASGYEVVDRTNLKMLLQEHKLASSGVIDPQTARRIGQIAGVQALVGGTITPFGDSVRLSVKILDAETAKVIGGTTYDMPRTKTVDELLKKPVGEATSQEAVARETNSKASTQIGHFQFLFRFCRINLGQVGCDGLVTNKGEQIEDLKISKDETYIVDNLGNKRGLQQVHLGDGGGSGQSLEPELPLEFWFTAGDFPDDAETVTISFSANGRRVLLRNIALERK